MSKRSSKKRQPNQTMSPELVALLQKGMGYHQAGNLEGAEAYYQQVLEMDTNNADAMHLMGLVHHSRGEGEVAFDLMARTVAQRPDMAGWQYNLGVVAQALGRFSVAVEAYQDALALDPGNRQAINNLIQSLIDVGRFSDALKVGEDALRESPSDGLRLAVATMLPAFMESHDQIKRVRERFENGLDDLLARDLSIEDPLREGLLTNFNLAYHGEDDLPLHRKVAQVWEKACPALLFTAPHVEGHCRSDDRPLRVGFYSRFLHFHSITRCFAKIIEHCAMAAGVHVTLFTPAEAANDAKSIDLAEKVQGGLVPLPMNLAAAQGTVAERELDVFVHLDIGMEFFGYALAFARLAPVQCVMNGHPSTTGIGNIDYYLSMGWAEPDEAEQHYSEKLVRLEHGGVMFTEPPQPTRTMSREELDLPPEGNLYLCPVKIHKLHPDFDAAVKGVLERDPNGHVVFFKERMNDVIHDLLRRRLERTLSPDVMQRVCFTSWKDGNDQFVGALKHAEVVLDPIHFGAHSTAVLLVAADVPMVSFPGKFFRERVGIVQNTYYEQTELVAASLEDYVEKAVRVGTDREYRTRLSEQIRDIRMRPDWYNNTPAADELVAFFKNCFDD